MLSSTLPLTSALERCG